MLVELTRYATRPVAVPDEGEDDGIDNIVDDTEMKIMINPAHVAAVFASRSEGATIVRLCDGRGFKIRGGYDEVSSSLLAAGSSQET